jgi:hypothetical protein
MRLACASLLIALALACERRPIIDEDPLPDAGDSDGGNPDANPTIPPWTGRPGDRCDPVSQSCGGQRCAADCERGNYGCVPRHPESRGTQGIVCTLDDDCAPGFVCVPQTFRGGTSAARCARYCRSQSECEAGTRCSPAEVHCTGGPVALLPRYLCLSR